MARLGSWIESSPRGHLRAACGRLDRSFPAQGPSVGDARPCRPCARRTWRGAGDSRDAGDHGDALRAASGRRRSPMTRAIRVGDVDVRFVPAGHVLGIGADRAWSIRARGSWSRATTSAGPIRPAPASCRCRATSSSPRRPSASRCSDIRIPEARSTGCCIGCMPIRSRCVLVGAYALGKAQRIITELRRARASRSDLFPRRDRAAVPALRRARRRARRPAPGDRRRERRR